MSKKITHRKGGNICKPSNKELISTIYKEL